MNVETTENPRTGLKRLLKNVLLEFCDDTTIHGCKNIGKESNNMVLRILWVCCLLACSSYCFYSCSQIFQNFYSYPSTTKISVVQEIPTLFPAFSFCNAKSLNMSSNLTRDYVKLHASSIIDEASVRFLTGNDQNLSETARKEMGFQIEEMLIYCYFNFKFCNYSDFKYFYNPLYGNCYTFNSGFFDNGTERKIETVSSNGYNYGLQIALYLGDPSADLYDTYYSGIVASINNQSIEPFTKGDLIKASATKSTDLIVNRNFITKLPAPYGNCLQDTSKSSTFSSKYFDYIVRNLGYNYSEEYCRSLCLQDRTIQLCGCANLWIPIFANNSSLYCESDTDQNCMLDFFSTYIDIFNAECNTACPVECYSIDYNIVSHSFIYPNYAEALNLYNWSKNTSKNLSLQDIPSAFLEVRVFYHSIQYTVTEQVIQMIQSDLLSSFGGVLGLFLGVSLLSFFEIVDLFWKLFQVLISFKKKKTKSKQISLKKPTVISVEENRTKQFSRIINTRVKLKSIRRKFIFYKR